MHMENSFSLPLPRITVVLVAMGDSIHVARWLQIFQGSNINFHLISSSPHRRLHPEIERLIRPQDGSAPQVFISKTSRLLSLPFWILDRFANDRIRGHLIKRKILSLNPDAVHAIEIQNAGYATLKAYESLTLEARPKLFITNYGSDIYWFGKQDKHKKRIEQTLKMADVYLCECERDVDLALQFGFRGETRPVHPNTGGLTYDQYKAGANSDLPSLRKTIALKGYQGTFGRAIQALQAIEQALNDFPDYQVEVFSANLATKRYIRKLSTSIRDRISVHGKHDLSHDEVLELFRRSRIYCGLSESDGISTSMLEAMSQGCFPIQTCTACANEWIIDGRDGYIVELNDIDGLVERISTALSNDGLVDRAKSSNLQTIYNRYLQEKLRMEFVDIYN